MTAPASAIPDEVRVDLAKEYVRQNFESGEPWSMTIARAILEERERCALIAGYYAQACLETESDGSGYYACSALIDEIRSPKAPEPPMQSVDDNDLPF